MDIPEIDRENLRDLLNDLAHYCIPFGKYGPDNYPPKGIPLYDLPPEYLTWFRDKGFPHGRLGELMEAVCNLKELGLDELFNPLRRANGGRVSTRKRK